MIKKQKVLIVGGSNGIGLALAMRLVKEKSVLIVDKVEPDYSCLLYTSKTDLNRPCLYVLL